MKEKKWIVIYLIIAVVIGLQSRTLSAEELTNCSNLHDRSWRGINCFHCLYPTAPEGALPIVNLLKNSCLKRVMISFVVDGSFGWNEFQIKQSIDILRANKQDVWLHLYVYNGPAQRRWQSKIFQSFAVMDPSEFQNRIVYDKKVRAEYSKIVRQRIAPIARYAISKGAKLSIAPGLEDNLDDRGFRAALQLLKKNLPKRTNIKYVRNPCYRCAIGNGRSIPKKILLEEHDDLLYDRRWNSIINTDGRYFRFSSENSSLPTLSDLVQSWLQGPAKRGNMFLLWVPHFQDAPYGVISKPLSQRNFRAPTQDESAEIIDFLLQ